MHPKARTAPPSAPRAVARTGTDATVVTYGSGVGTAFAAIERTGADVEVVDLRTIWPLDEDTVLASVEKTSRVLVLQEAAGPPARRASSSPSSRDARSSTWMRRRRSHAPPDTPVPFAPELEDAYLPSVESTATALEALLAY